MNLRDLSEKLGLSQTTVSRALNGYPEVSEKTRERVQNAAKEFNYHPNLRAKSLATGRAMSIGHVVLFSEQHEMINVIFSDFIAGAGEIYGKHGYDMRIVIVKAEEEADAYAKLAENGTVDGVIVHGPTEDDPRIALLSELGLPFVVHGRSSHVTTPYSFLDVNNKRAIERATNFLLDLGHRRIGLVNGLVRMDFAARRRAGYIAAIEAAGLTFDPALHQSADMDEPHGYNAAKEMLALDNPPTALIAASIIAALGIRRAVEECGLTVGKDVSIICFDDEISYLPNGSGEPIFTATRSSVRDAGKECAEMLIRKIANPDIDEMHELWEAELVVGSSTGPAPNTSLGSKI